MHTPPRRSLLVALLVIGMALLAAPAYAGGRPLATTLAAEHEVGQPGDPGTSGSAHLALNQGQGEICFDIDVAGESSPILAAHIHAAPAGSNGGVVVDFQWATTGGSGCVDADADLIKDIRQHPENYYINVHNATAPAGAARGQLGK